MKTLWNDYNRFDRIFVTTTGHEEKRGGIKRCNVNRCFNDILGEEISIMNGTGMPSMDGEMLLKLAKIVQQNVNDYLLRVMIGQWSRECTNHSHNELSIFSEALGISTTYASQTDRGARSCSRDTIDEIIVDAAKQYNVDADLIRAVIETESDFKMSSTSAKGAMGLMQLMPETANDMGVNNAYDPWENIMGGTRYLKMLLDRYDGNIDLTLSAYNWGMGNVERHPEKMPQETTSYIVKVKKLLAGMSSQRRSA